MQIMPSISADIVTTVVYGTAATIIGVVTIYQSYMAWRLWREHHHNSGQSSQDVELALGSSLVVRPEPSNTASTDIAPVHDTDNLQPVANEVTAPTSSHQRGPSNSSTSDLEPAEFGNESQAAASPGIAPDAAFALPLQPLPTPELDVVPVQDTNALHAVANTDDPSASYPTLNPLNPPRPSARSNTPVHSTDEF